VGGETTSKVQRSSDLIDLIERGLGLKNDGSMLSKKVSPRYLSITIKSEIKPTSSLSEYLLRTPEKLASPANSGYHQSMVSSASTKYLSLPLGPERKRVEGRATTYTLSSIRTSGSNRTLSRDSVRGWAFTDSRAIAACCVHLSGPSVIEL
jgi:hypothetical protein